MLLPLVHMNTTRLNRSSGSIQRGPRFSQVMPFLCELSPRQSGKERTVRRNLLVRGELALSQTGRALQPLDRHLRYYSEGPLLASHESVQDKGGGTKVISSVGKREQTPFLVRAQSLRKAEKPLLRSG